MNEIEKTIVQDNHVRVNGFINEKDFIKYLEANIDELLSSLNIKPIVFEREYRVNIDNISKFKHYSLDYLIIDEFYNKIILEIKAPQNSSEMLKGLGNCLYYHNMESPDLLIIICTVDDEKTRSVIDKFCLPIKFYCYKELIK